MTARVIVHERSCPLRVRSNRDVVELRLPADELVSERRARLTHALARELAALLLRLTTEEETRH